MDFDRLKKAVIEMDDKTVRDLVNEGLKDQIDPQYILDEGLIAGIKEVGELFSRKEYFVPEVLLASEAFYAGFHLISPLIKKQNLKKKAKVVIGVVEGDIHDIGKNIVKVLVEASGYNVIDLGKDVPTKRFVETIVKEKPEILAMSSLMTTTMMHMEKVIRELEKRKLRGSVKVVVGGAPVNEDFAEKVKADAYGKDATDAVRIIDNLTSG